MVWFHLFIVPFSPVQKNQPVIDLISRLNVRNKALSTVTCDFFTVPTNIQHNKLKTIMRELIKNDEVYVTIP